MATDDRYPRQAAPASEIAEPAGSEPPAETGQRYVN